MTNRDRELFLSKLYGQLRTGVDILEELIHEDDKSKTFTADQVAQYSMTLYLIYQLEQADRALFNCVRDLPNKDRETKDRVLYKDLWGTWNEVDGPTAIPYDIDILLANDKHCEITSFPQGYDIQSYCKIYSYTHWTFHPVKQTYDNEK